MASLIQEIIFRAGEKPGTPNLSIQPSNVVIFVGPNNSGKSSALKEIEGLLSGSNKPRAIIDNLNLNLPADTEIEAFLNNFEADPPENQGSAMNHRWVGQLTFNQRRPENLIQIDPRNILSSNSNTAQRTASLKSSFFNFLTIRLDGRTRFGLSDPKPTGDLQSRPKNHLWALFKDDAAREKVRLLTMNAFNLHFTIDPTGMKEFKVRLSKRQAASLVEEQSLNATSRDFHKNAALVTEMSDGVQAFVGLVSAVLSLEHKYILIDEPEAFLHPPLARRLGSDLTKIAAERDANLFVATHSSQFIMGCIESGYNVSVVRLTYENNVSTARTMSSDEIKDLFKNPLLRSTGVLQGMFHKGVIVCESDTDRAFYDEINRRLISAGRGVSDVYIANAQNKQTTYRIAGPLRKLGIPAAILVDLDVLKCTGVEWSRLVDACNIPQAEHAPLIVERDYFKNLFQGLPRQANDPEPIKRGGISKLSPGDQARLKLFLDKLAGYGFIIVPIGEVEAWLGHLSVPGKGTDWLIEMFEKMKDSEDEQDYIGASTGDVWEFMDSVSVWLNNQNRLGL